MGDVRRAAGAHADDLAVLSRRRVDAAAGLPRPPLLSHRHGRTGRNRDRRQDAGRTRPHDRTAAVAAPCVDQRRVGDPGCTARARKTRRRDGRVRTTTRSCAQGERRQGRCLRRGSARRRRRLLLQGLVGLPDGTRFGRPGRHVPRCGDVADYAGAVRTASAFKPEPDPQPEPKPEPKPDEPSAPAAPVADPAA